MTLPEAFENRFETNYTEMENEHTMAQTMPPLWRRAQARGEAIGEQRGQEIGAQRGALSEARSLLLGLGRKRLGEPGTAIEAQVEAIEDRERLEYLCLRVYDVESWEELLAASQLDCANQAGCQLPATLLHAAYQGVDWRDDRDGEEADDHAEEHDHQRLQHRGQGLQPGVDLPLVVGGHAQEDAADAADFSPTATIWHTIEG